MVIHSTRLGPALGGTRVFPYQTDQDALQDALFLSKGMTYKNSLAGLNFGGGKTVISAPSTTPEMMVKLGEVVESLEGKYITAEDVGTTVADMVIASKYTRYIVRDLDDPSPWTARGVAVSMETALKHTHLGARRAMRVWIQGLGKVGWELAKYLYNNGYILYVSDLNQQLVQAAIEQFSARPYEEKTSPIDIYAPCAMGQVITPENVDSVMVKIICGSANNQLLNDDLAKTLQKNGVLYAPDFLVNAGGVISAAENFKGNGQKAVEERVTALGKCLDQVIVSAKASSSTPLEAAKRLAETRLDVAGSSIS
jgi:leucine dehydrogenase